MIIPEKRISFRSMNDKQLINEQHAALQESYSAAAEADVTSFFSAMRAFLPDNPRR